MDKKEYVILWIRKADGDLKVAERELKAQDSVLDAVCFHLQQAVEKYLKAFLINSLKEVKKTHNLEFLLEKCIQQDGDFRRYEEKFDQVSECGVEIRYPDSFIQLDEEELGDCLKLVRQFREFVLDKMAIDI